jgi:hypothetical protein
MTTKAEPAGSGDIKLAADIVAWENSNRHSSSSGDSSTGNNTGTSNSNSNSIGSLEEGLRHRCSLLEVIINSGTGGDRHAASGFYAVLPRTAEAFGRADGSIGSAADAARWAWPSYVLASEMSMANAAAAGKTAGKTDKKTAGKAALSRHPHPHPRLRSRSHHGAVFLRYYPPAR